MRSFQEVADAYSEECFAELWSRAQPTALRICKRRGCVDPAWQQVCLARKSPKLSQVNHEELTLSWLRAHSGARARRVASLKLSGKEGLSRAALEKQEISRWRGILAELAIEAELPIKYQAALASPDAPLSMVENALGCMRASTIRKRVQEWRKIRNYSLGMRGKPWPQHVGVLLAYLKERCEEPCARTVPEAIKGALVFMEKVGCVLPAERLSSSAILKNFVSQATQDLETGAPPTKKAPLLPVMLIGSLEIMVLSESQPLFARAFAFYKLLKVWSCCRSSDLECLQPTALRLLPLGLSGLLERTKTTGPGKRVRHLPIFVARGAALMAPAWLEVGWKIWQQAELAFERDFFLPLPNAAWSEARTIMADYADVVGLSKHLLRRLERPKWENHRWVGSGNPLLLTEAAISFWSEHSERNWLNSMLAARPAKLLRPLAHFHLCR